MKIPKKENKNIEFKEKLKVDVHLKKSKKQHLATQMKYLLEVGNGIAVYILGVKDNGQPANISDFELEESINVLSYIAKEVGAYVYKVEKYEENGSKIAKVIVRYGTHPKKEHIIVATAGHVSHGKSTLIATLMLGKPDLKGKNWLYINVLPHEIERGLTADLHHAFIAFKNNKPLYFKNPLNVKEKQKLFLESDKIISFVDTVGHEPWIRTTIRGIVGQDIDYGLLVVASDDSVTHITKEHLGILLSMHIPVIVVITKIDKVSKTRVQRTVEDVEKLLKRVGKIPFLVKNESDIVTCLDKLDLVTPMILTSAKTREGYELLEKLLNILPPRERKKSDEVLMYIDKVYNISGVGAVVSGTIKIGKIKIGDELLLGPFGNSFRKVRVGSIQIHYQDVKEVDAGFIVGISLRGVKPNEIRRGMILTNKKKLAKAVRRFEAEIMVLTHPTKITNGYEPVLHCNTISQTVKLKLLDKDYLKSGETGRVVMEFKYRPEVVFENEKFVFREGKTKGIGKIIKVLD